MQHRPENLAASSAGETVELRVHGVGGASPEELLGVPLTERVAGDPAAGFFRPWFDPDRRPTDPVLEGYSWGGLTSASRLRSLWVLLSPFALANLAGWMLRHGGQATDVDGRSRNSLESIAAGVIRVYGVVLTVAVLAFVGVGTIDLVSYQCGAHPTCPGGRWWLSPWDNSVVGGHTGRALAVGAGVAAVVALGLAGLTRLSQAAIHDRTRVDYHGRDDPVFELNLNHWRLWTSPHVAHRLGLTHTAAALWAVGVTAAATAVESGVVDSGVWVRVGWAGLAVTTLAAARLDRVPSVVHLTLAVMSGAYVVGVVVTAWTGTDAPAVPGPAPGATAVPALLLPVYPALALGAGAAALVLWRRHRESPLRVALVAPALLLFASGIVNAFGSGLLIRLADLIGTPVAASGYPVSEPVTQPPIVYADAISDTAVITVLTLIVLVAAVGVVWVRAGVGPDCEELAARYADRGGLDCTDPADRRWGRRVGQAEAVARLTDHAAVVVGSVTLIVLVGTAVAVLATRDPAGMRLGEWANVLAGPASLVLGLIPLVAVYGIARLYRSPAARRLVGSVWDVATFWPRWFHPWSPPAYGERAVPQLGDRLTVLTGNGPVVVSAHSQGSVLAVATLCLADPSVLARTALLTHGSPLTRLYARYFPEYFTESLYSDLAGRLHGWINLWRPTDYIGGPVVAAGVDDHRVFDPPSTRPPSLGEARPRPFRHSAYDRTAEYQAARASLLI